MGNCFARSASENGALSKSSSFSFSSSKLPEKPENDDEEDYANLIFRQAFSRRPVAGGTFSRSFFASTGFGLPIICRRTESKPEGRPADQKQASRRPLTLNDRLEAWFAKRVGRHREVRGNFLDGDRRDACPTQAGAFS